MNQKVKTSFDSRNLSLVRIFLLILLVQTSLTFLLPPMISHDGYNYLSSGKSLFTSDFPYRYQLMREPGFPFVVWLAYRTGNVLLALALLQSVFLSLTATLFYKLFTQKFKLGSKATMFCIFIGLITVRGYSNTILQVCIIILILSILIYYLIWLTENRRLTNKPYLYAGILSCTAASINSALMCSVIGSVLASQILLRQHWRQFIKMLASIILGIGLILVPWYSTIFPIDVNSQMIPSPHTSFELNYFEKSSPIEDNLIRLKSLGSLLLVYPDRAPGYPSGYSLPGKELMLFGNYWAYGKMGECLINHGGQTEVIEYVSSDIKTRCVSSWILAGQSLLSRLLTPLYLTSGVIFLIAGVLAIVRKRTEMQMFILPVAILISVYGVGGAGISRFSAILPLMSPLLAYWLWATLKIKGSYDGKSARK